MGLFAFVGMKLDLEKNIGKKVDLVTYKALHPLLKEQILEEQGLSMKRKVEFFLKDILQSISDIEAFVGQMSKDDFLKDRKTQSAVVRQIEIIGEAIKYLPVELKATYLHVPWKEIAGMRDVIIHEYFGVDTDLVWNAIKNDVPFLEREIKEMIQSTEDE